MLGICVVVWGEAGVNDVSEHYQLVGWYDIHHCVVYIYYLWWRNKSASILEEILFPDTDLWHTSSDKSVIPPPSENHTFIISLITNLSLWFLWTFFAYIIFGKSSTEKTQAPYFLWMNREWYFLHTKYEE